MTNHAGLIDDSDFHVLLEATPHPYLILWPDEQFTIVAVNDRYLRVTGTKREDILGRGLFDVFPDNPADVSASGAGDLHASLQRVVHEGVEDVMGIQKYDIPPYGRDAKEDGGFVPRYWTPVNIPVFDRERRIRFIIHHVEDVTEYLRAREQFLQEPSRSQETVHTSADRMEAKILRSAAELKATNRKLKAAKKQLEQQKAELTRLTERLRELDRSRTEFIAHISHEFRTPLTVLLLPLEQLLNKAETINPAQLKTLIERAYRNALRLYRLVDTLLDFSRLEEHRAQPQYELTDLGRYTMELASNFRAISERAGVEFKVHCPPSPKPIPIDRRMWERIVLNLLSNAFKFTRAGAVEIRSTTVDGTAELVVSDTGIGIPESDLPHLFERFYRSHRPTGPSHEGSGIGLALVNEMVRLHHGTIHVESRFGEGTRFTVRIPLAVAPGVQEAPSIRGHSLLGRAAAEDVARWLPETEARVPQLQHRSGDIGISHWHVLVADDDADMRAYLQRLLQDAGFEVEAVGDGLSALAACRNDLPDLALIDVMLPGMDGVALLQRIRMEPEIANLPVILLTGQTGERALAQGLGAVPDDYVVKPFHAQELVGRIESAIRLAQFRATAVVQDRLRRTIIESASEGIVVADEAKRVLAVNPAFTDITGYAANEIVGQKGQFPSAAGNLSNTSAAMWETLNTQGYWRGDLWNRRKNGELFLKRMTVRSLPGVGRQPLRYVAIFSDVTELHRQDDRLKHLALYDALTDLPNQFLFEDRLQQALVRVSRDGRRLAVLFVDLDRFSRLNESLGHEVGDALLRNVAETLQANLRWLDVTARIDGDKFGIVLEELRSPRDCNRVAENILAVLRKPVILMGHRVKVTASIGIALFPEDGATPCELLGQAEAAARAEKPRGGDGYRFARKSETALGFAESGAT
jgi:diguanylate cyclase (GGDEF)-like protein/PAS domain S-box-containing protein